jgi:deoxyribodipyrimidine photolyase-related protein
MHPQKLVLFFSAMRHFAQELRELGWEVIYLQAETLEEALARFFEVYPGETLAQMRPADYGFAERVQAMVERAEGRYRSLPNPLWLLQPEEFDRWAGSRKTYRLEYFYRFMCQRTGYLMQGASRWGVLGTTTRKTAKPLRRATGPRRLCVLSPMRSPGRPSRRCRRSSRAILGPWRGSTGR